MERRKWGFSPKTGQEGRFLPGVWFGKHQTSVCVHQTKPHSSSNPQADRSYTFRSQLFQINFWNTMSQRHIPVNVWITPEENQWVWAHPKEWRVVSIEIFLLWPLCAIVIPASKTAFNASELRSTVEVNSNVYNCVASNKSSDKSEDSQQTPCWWKQEVNAKLWYYISSRIRKVRRALCLHTFSCFMQIQW